MLHLLLISAMFFAQAAVPSQGSGTVTGRLLLADGSPAAGVRVSTMSVPESGRPAAEVPALSNLTETDGSGRFRLENIKAGRYYIVAGLLDYPTYYPGTSVAGDARIVNITAGSTTSGIEFQAVRSSTGFTVSGHVRREGSSPYGTPTQVTLTSMMSGENQTDLVGLDGKFQFQKVRPGNYRISVTPGTGFRNQNILIRDKDVSGLELVIPWSTEVHGRVVLDGLTSANPPVVSISFAGNSVQNDSNAQSEFQANLAEGNYSIVVSDIPSGFFLKSVIAGTADLLTSPFRLPKSATPPEIVVTLGVSTPGPWVKLSGKITGTLPPGFGQFSGLNLNSNTSGSSFRTSVAADGTFQFPALLPGMYSVSFPILDTMLPMSIMVPNRDIAGIEIPVPSVKSISGRIEVPAGSPLPRVSLNVTGMRAPLPARPGPPSFADLLVSLETWAINSGSQNFVVNPQADGTFKINLPAGEYQITASLLSNGAFNGDAYVVKSFTYGPTDLLHEPANLTDAISSELKLTLEPIPGRAWFKVSGRVTGMDQAWLNSRPSVALFSPVFVPSITAQVNSDGSFEFPRVYSGSYSARLTSGSLSAPPKEINITDKNVTNVEFAVVPQREVRGRVLVEGATPAPKLTVPLVSASNRANSRNAGFGSFPETKSLSIDPQPDGSFTVKVPAGTHRVGAIGGLPDGAMVKSFTYGAIDLIRNSLQVDAAADPAELVLTLSYPKATPVRAAGRIIGLDTASRTSSPIRVVLSDPSFAREQVVTAGTDGSFEFPEVLPGSYRASVTGIDSMKGVVTSLVVPDAGVDNLTIRVPMRKDIRGRIVVEGGGPIPFAKLTLRSTTPDSTETSVEVESDTDGTFHAALLEGSILGGVALPGGYELIAASYGAASLSHPPLLISGTDDSELQIRVKAPGDLSAVRVRGTVQGLSATALAAQGIRVSLASSIYAHPGSTVVKSDGSFEFANAFSGRYILRLSGPGLAGNICVQVHVRDSDVVDVRMAAAPANIANDIQIISAVFGASGGSADVTPIVARLTSPERNEFYANPYWLEVDPAIGETKDLVIFYQHQCEEHVFSVSESIAVSHAILAAHADSLHDKTSSASRGPIASNTVNGNEITILNAFYGLGGRFNSVTARLNQLLGPGAKPVTVNDATFDAGGSGAKILIVTYLDKGDRISFFAFQGNSISYTSLIANAESYKRSSSGSSVLPAWFDDAQPDPPREPGDRGPGVGPDPRKEMGIHLLLKAVAELQAIPAAERQIGAVDVEKGITLMRQAITSVQNNINFRYPPASDKPIVPYLRVATRSVRLANALKFVERVINQLNSANPGANPEALSNAIVQARQSLAYLQLADFAK